MRGLKEREGEGRRNLKKGEGRKKRRGKEQMEGEDSGEGRKGRRLGGKRGQRE